MQNVHPLSCSSENGTVMEGGKVIREERQIMGVKKRKDEPLYYERKESGKRKDT